MISMSTYDKPSLKPQNKRWKNHQIEDFAEVEPDSAYNAAPALNSGIVSFRRCPMPRMLRWPMPRMLFWWPMCKDLVFVGLVCQLLTDPV